MRLKGVRPSRNVEVRKGRGGPRRAGVGRGGGIGIIGLLVILGFGLFTGVDVTPLLTGEPGTVERSAPVSPQDDAAIQFSARVLSTTEDVWTRVFSEQLGERSVPPQLVVFSGVTRSACGGASGATGPFYCPIDSKAYLDTQFFVQLDRQMGAGGDFAAAYVMGYLAPHLPL